MSKKVYVINEMAAYSLPSNFKDFIQFFQAHLDSVPDEFRDKVTIDLETVDNWGNGSIEINVYYYRPFTEEEAEKEKQKLDRDNEAKLRFKREQLEKLKRELGEC